MTSEDLRRTLAAVARPDILFAGLFLLLVAILMLPIPTVVIDMLVAMNLSFAVMIMVTTLYLRSVLELSTFPSIILISTVFRLALTVASTRMILSTGDAGHIIRGFGQFVIAGNIIVGVIVFVILALVQFLVITKGAERIAEVSARFTLDALPGKQLSIDNDLRNGVLNGETAAHRRFVLEKESQFFGAMDGAMRFVKGDAIASFTIAFVNLLGGVGIGMLQQGLSFGQALHVYSLLTIGEGLVSQIPAMLTSVAAGAVVTRVVADDSQSLGVDIGRQVLRQPRTLFIAAGAITALAFVPGFPWPTLLALAGGIGGLGVSLLRAARRAEAEGRAAAPNASASAGTDAPAEAAQGAPAAAPRPLASPEWGDPLVLRGAPVMLQALELAGLADKIDAAIHAEARRAGFAITIPKFAPGGRAPTGMLEITVEGRDGRPDPRSLRLRRGADRRRDRRDQPADVGDDLLALRSRPVARRYRAAPGPARRRAARPRPADPSRRGGAAARHGGDAAELSRPFFEALLAEPEENLHAEAMAALGQRVLMVQAMDAWRNAAGALPAVTFSPEAERAFAVTDDSAMQANLVGELLRTITRLRQGDHSPVLLLRAQPSPALAQVLARETSACPVVTFDDVPADTEIDVLARIELPAAKPASPTRLQAA